MDFNLSHSGHLFSFIVVDNIKLKVGIDIERIRAINDLKSIETRFFSIVEYEYIFNLSNATEIVINRRNLAEYN